MSFQNKQELLFFPATAEKLLTHIPPNYTAERKQIFIRIASTALLFVVLLPFALTDILRRLRIRKLRKLMEQEQASVNNNSSNHKDESQRIIKTLGKNKKTGGKKNDEVIVTTDEPTDIEQNVHVVLPWTVWSIFNIFAILGVVILLLLTSNNKYCARGIFSAPLFTLKECQEYIVLYDTVSKDNNPLSLEHFPEPDKENMLRILNSRLAPLIERVYGIVPRAMAGCDISIIRMNNASSQQRISSNHFPSIIFHVILNESKGGQIKFTNRIDHNSAEIKSDSGSVILFDATMDHHLLSVADDERQYVLSGVVSVHLHGLDGQHTGISHCASWLSLTWLRVFFQRSAAVRSNGIIKSVFEKLGLFVERFTDLWAPHFFINLVDKSYDGKHEDFIVALDNNPITWIVDDRKKAKWIQVEYIPVESEINFDPNVLNLEF